MSQRAVPPPSLQPIELFAVRKAPRCACGLVDGANAPWGTGGGATLTTLVLVTVWWTVIRRITVTV